MVPDREQKGKFVQIKQNVICFAIHHKKPIRRSAFTYRTSSIWKTKVRWPYTTEQVEDVRVMLNILKIVFSFGPVLPLEYSAASSYIKHNQ